MYDLLTLQAWYEQFYKRWVAQPDQKYSGYPGSWVLSEKLFADAYGYPVSFTNFASLAATNTTQTQNVQINANADFVLTRISYFASIAAVSTVSSMPVAQCRMQIIDAGSARPFWNAAVMLENFASHVNPQRFLAVPKFVPANSTLTCTMTGNAGAAETLVNVEIFLEGVSIKRFG